MTALLSVEKIEMWFGGLQALQSISLQVRQGEIFAVIGPNGAGKTTLFNVISGIYPPKSGRILLDGREITGLPPHELARQGLSRTFQNQQIFFRMSAIENVMVGRHIHENRNALAHLFTLPSVIRQNRETKRMAEEFLSIVGLSHVADHSAGTLAYGPLKRLEIARALATDPKILLLDEPAAGCNPTETQEIDAVIQNISQRGVTVVLVEHDMRLVMKISNRIHVLDRGYTLAEGDPATMRADPAVVAAYLGKKTDTHVGTGD